MESELEEAKKKNTTLECQINELKNRQERDGAAQEYMEIEKKYLEKLTEMEKKFTEVSAENSEIKAKQLLNTFQS